MQVRVCPSTVQVRVVLPSPTAVTVPSEETVATEVSPMLQDGAEEVPETFIRKVSPDRWRVKSVRFRLREPELELVPEPELAAVKLQRTVQVWLTPLARDAVMVVCPFSVPGVTSPLLSTVATAGLLLLQVTVPDVPDGVSVATSCTGSG